MKKPLLLLLFLILLPIWIWAQGFGGFASDQPFFAKDRAMGNGLPTAEYYGWWTISRNLTNDASVSPPANGDSLIDWGKNYGNFEKTLNGASGARPLYVGFGGSNYLGSVRMDSSYEQKRNWNMQSAGGYAWTQPITLFVFVKVTSNNPNGFQGIVASIDAPELRLTHNSAGNLEMNAGSSVTGPNTIALNHWYLVTCVYDGANSYMRTNGADYAAGNVGANGMSGIFIGKQYELNDHLHLIGENGDFAFFNRRLTTNEITTMEAAMAGTNSPTDFGSWNPTTNSDALSVYDVSMLSANDGDLIDSVPDQTPKAYHLLASGTARPYWTNNTTVINNKGYAYFDGSTDILRTNYTTTYPQPTTIYMISRNRGKTGGVASAWHDNGFAQSAQVSWEFNSNGLIDFATPGGTVETTSTIPTLHNWHLIEWVYNGASRNLYMDGQPLALTGATVGTTGRTGLSIGKDRSDATPSELEVAFVGIYTNSLSATTRSNITIYLLNRFTP